MPKEIAEVVTMLAAVNGAAVIVMVVLSFVGSALALEGLEWLDGWIRRREERRPAKPLAR